ncbi:DUF2285 domain-containing protein [Roseibium sp. M-1]
MNISYGIQFLVVELDRSVKSRYAPLASSTDCSQISVSSTTLTAYDTEHFTTYMQLLTFASDGASTEEMARDVLGLDPLADADGAKLSVETHLQRANWLLTSGYKDLSQPAG